MASHSNLAVYVSYNAVQLRLLQVGVAVKVRYSYFNSNKELPSNAVAGKYFQPTLMAIPT